MQYNRHESLIMHSVQLPLYKTSVVTEADFGKVNLRNMLNYEFTPKNNVFAMVVHFIVIIIHFFFKMIISLTKEATFPYTNLSFSARVGLNFYSNNVKLLSLISNN